MVKSVFDANDDFAVTKTRKRLAKSLSTFVIKKSISFTPPDIQQLQRYCLDFIFSEVVSSAVSNYVLSEFKPMILVSAQVSGNHEVFDVVHLAKRGAIKQILIDYGKENSLQFVASEIDKIIEEISMTGVNSIENTYDEDKAPYYRTSLVKQFIEDKHEISCVKVDSSKISELLSNVRLALMILDAKSMSPSEYYNQIELSLRLKNRELNAEYHELNSLVYQAESKFYDERYKLDNRHYELIFDYVDDWTSKLVREVCDVNISSSKELIKRIVGYISIA